ncbi:hypothetical protein O181_037790 [Austropuccinia psidii MF-1]|uniref:Uncharacterized protein n=1 Tax=Austropuccinia psidii MF-1 TaxID=1389203 RepID=A0A9Q3D8U2_9BASI|nr:hypothetical protein [Austropuccinia psidii MF-1]
MEGEAPSRKGCVNSRRSISFSGFLCGYPSISQGPRSILGEAEDEEGEESGEEEESEEISVAASLECSPEASEAPNIALSNEPLVSQAEPNFMKIMEQMTQFMGKLTQEVSTRDNPRAPELKTP